jgi:hypothetical protein
MQLTGDEQALLVVGIAFLIIVLVWLWASAVRANIMLRAVRERMDPALWQELGAPESFKAAMNDPKRRWMKFVRSGEYRKRCGSDVVELIDDFKGRTNRMLIILGVASALLLYRFWPILSDALFSPRF